MKSGTKFNGIYKSRDGIPLHIGEKVYYNLKLVTITDIFGGQSGGQIHFKETNNYCGHNYVFVNKNKAFNQQLIYITKEFSSIRQNFQSSLENVEDRLNELNKFINE